MNFDLAYIQYNLTPSIMSKNYTHWLDGIIRKNDDALWYERNRIGSRF